MFDNSSLATKKATEKWNKKTKREREQEGQKKRERERKKGIKIYLAQVHLFYSKCLEIL